MVLSRLRTTDPWRWLAPPRRSPLGACAKPGFPRPTQDKGRSAGLPLAYLALARHSPVPFVLVPPTCCINALVIGLERPAKVAGASLPPPWRSPPLVPVPSSVSPGPPRTRARSPCRLSPATPSPPPVAWHHGRGPLPPPPGVSRVSWVVLWVSCGARVLCFPCVPLPPGAVVL